VEVNMSEQITIEVGDKQITIDETMAHRAGQLTPDEMAAVSRLAAERRLITSEGEPTVLFVAVSLALVASRSHRLDPGELEAVIEILAAWLADDLVEAI
jgi:hypothetical protein